VAAIPGARPSSRASLAISDVRSRAAWLVLATSSPAADIGRLANGATVSVTDDPQVFRDLLRSERPRIVVCSQPPATDWDLGLVLDERRRGTLRAVLLTPPDAVDRRLAALADGFDDALASSVPVEELIGRLAWLDARTRPAAREAAILRFGNGYELDTAAHQLRRDGVVIHLRPKEYGLLALLATHPGRVYGRAELLDRVWGPSHDAGARTVDVHVRWLRAKIEAEPERPVNLVTVRGVGYRLDARVR
jgi:two-component system response regulator RegX3